MPSALNPLAARAMEKRMSKQRTHSEADFENPATAANAAFDVLDKRGDGLVTVAELCFFDRKHVYDEATKRVSDKKHSPSAFKQMQTFSRLDLNGDGVISREEFVEVRTRGRT